MMAPLADVPSHGMGQRLRSKDNEINLCDNGVFQIDLSLPNVFCYRVQHDREFNIVIGTQQVAAFLKEGLNCTKTDVLYPGRAGISQ